MKTEATEELVRFFFLYLNTKGLKYEEKIRWKTENIVECILQQTLINYCF